MKTILTPKEASQILGITTETLIYWTKTGKINCLFTPRGHRQYFLLEVQKIKESKTRCKKSFAETNPDLANQWHPTKNGILKPNDITKGIDKRVWWKCPVADDHEWEASLLDRTRRGNKCPMCARKNKVVLSNCVATTHPEIVKQWHPTKNERLTPLNCLSGSKKKIWWICENGHEWNACLNNRTCNLSGCPHCIKNPLPEDLISQWHSKNKLNPNQVDLKGRDKVWWKCPIADDHEWEATLCNRAKGTGCPCCALHKVVKSNCLATTHPEIASQWHSDNILNTNEVMAGSTKKYWWQCDKNKKHKWEARIVSRTTSGSGCPYCKSSNGEKLIEKILTDLDIKFEKEWTHDECVNINKLRFDFAVYGKKFGLIEFQGIQHFKPISFGSGENVNKKFELTKKRDLIKVEFCTKENLPLLKVPYFEKNPQKLVSDFLKTLTEIKK